MRVGEMLALYDYHYWAVQRVLDAARQVDGSQFTADPLNSLPSMRNVLVHVVSGDWVWRQRWEGVAPQAALQPADFPKLREVESRWRDELEPLARFTWSLTDADLQRGVKYRTLRGAEYASPLWQLMLHVVNHSTQHLSEVAVLLTDYGSSPGGLDLIYYLRSAQTP